jgi:hypothetical protein
MTTSPVFDRDTALSVYGRSSMILASTNLPEKIFEKANSAIGLNTLKQ